jgi:hypothetical protein
MPLFSSRSSPKRNNIRFNSSYEASVPTGKCFTVDLTCLSADSSSIHSLSPKDGIITTYFLPFEEQHGRNGVSRFKVVSKLPDYITQSLKIDPPLGMTCVDNFTVDGTKKSHGKVHLPLLCIYNCKSAYMLDISYDRSCSIQDEDLVEGSVNAVMEPFETHLMSSKLASVKILRIRAAPQSCFFGGGFYETLNPRGAMVMLTTSTFIYY